MIPNKKVIGVKKQSGAKIITCTYCGKENPPMVLWMGELPFCSFDCHQKWKNKQKMNTDK